jgi:hypothetical protein
MLLNSETFRHMERNKVIGELLNVDEEHLKD